MRGARRFQALGIGCAAAVLLASGADAAQAARISTSTDARGGQQVLYEAARGEANDVTVSFRDGAWVFEQPGAPPQAGPRQLQAGPGCTATESTSSLGSTSTGTCRTPAPAALRVDLGDQDDSLRVDGVDPGFGGQGAAVTALGGAGNDLLIGSPVDDRLNGGTGADRIDGREGRDSAGYPRSQYPRMLDDLKPEITLDGRANDGKTGEDDNVANVEEIDTIDRTIDGINGPDAPLVAPPLPDGPAITDDLLVDTGGSGTVDAGNGNDLIDSTDGQPDTLLCGAGDDVALGDPVDQPVDCESFKAPEASEPRAGRQMEVKPISGDLLSFAFGDDGQLVPLRDEVDLPLDSPVSATGGTVQVTVAATTGTDPRTESAQITGGSFTVGQTVAPQGARVRAAAAPRKATTDLRLADPDPANCPRSLRVNKVDTKIPSSSRAFTVTGQFAQATPGRRGLTVRIRQTCDITYVLIRSGAATVSNLVTGQQTTLKRGQTLYARRGHG